jgi:hypothetical protein
MKFRVFNKKTKEYMPSGYFTNSLGQLFMEDVMDGYVHREEDEDLIVQFSTGIMGECGEEIYEGDIVSWEDTQLAENGLIYKTREAGVVYSPFQAAFVLDIYGRHLFDDKYGDFQYLHNQQKYTIKK